MHDKVDVLIIGSGASGAAVAWSLAETRMKILCLEQGDWMKQSDYPTNGPNGDTASRSWHPGGVNTLLADGSVRFIKNSISLRTWQALSTTRGGEVISSDSY